MSEGTCPMEGWGMGCRDSLGGDGGGGWGWGMGVGRWGMGGWRDEGMGCRDSLGWGMGWRDGVQS